jgi:hypothetical protein
MVRSTQTVHLSCIKISTISKWTKRSFQLCLVTYQGVSSGSSKMISEPKVRLVQIVHLSCMQTDRNGITHDLSHVGVPSGVSKMISEPKVRLVQIVHLSCMQTDRNGITHEPSHVGVPSGLSKMISGPLIRSTQIVLLSCVKINTISKRTKTSFQLSLIT